MKALPGSLRTDIVGRERELEEILAALSAGRNLLLEGPPGTSKSTLLRAVAQAAGRPFAFVEGSAELTPAKLVGHHNPATVLRHGYRAQDFVPGPLFLMMREGGLLYIEEFNRIPEDTLNVLLGPLAERSLVVERVGVVQARKGFALVGAMNPFDATGTLRISRSVLDRLCRLPLGYQDEEEEQGVVRLKTGSRCDWLVRGAVSLVRATRSHPEVEMGSSVRGAIDLVLVAERLGHLRDVRLSAGSIREVSRTAKLVVLDAALISLSSRLVPAETTERTPEEIVHELWQDVFLFAPQRATGERFLALKSVVAARPGGSRRRGWGGVISSPKRQTDRSRLPKPGVVRGKPRIYGPNEMVLLSADRVAGTAPRKVEDIRRDNPKVREVLSAECDLDTEALRELYEKDEEAALSLLGDLWTNIPDPKLRELTRRLALRIVLRRTHRTATARPGRGKLTAVRYRFNSDDLDLDRTLQEIAGVPLPEYSDFWVNERVRTRRAYAILLDVSGSMRGAKLLHVALAASSLARSVKDEDLAVVAFWRDAAVVQSMGAAKPLARLLDDVLAVGARGLTNLRLGLEVALRELERSTAREKEGILLTDGLHNVGEDPLPVVERYPRLHVIGTSLEERRVSACQDLAYRGRGRCAFVERLDDIPTAIAYCLSG